MNRIKQLPFVLARGGTYLIDLRLAEKLTVEIGALGRVSLGRGRYLYAGSALRRLGPRVLRHLTRARGAPQPLWIALDKTLDPSTNPPPAKRPRWHLDYLVERPEVEVTAVWLLPDRAAECDLAGGLGSVAGVRPAAAGFGSSDCRRGCGAHLLAVVPGNARRVERLLRDLAPVWQVRLTRAGQLAVRCLRCDTRPSLL